MFLVCVTTYMLYWMIESNEMIMILCVMHTVVVIMRIRVERNVKSENGWVGGLLMECW